MIKKVVKFFVVDFKEGALYYELGLLLPFIHLIKYESNNSRNDSEVFIFQANGVTTTHCEGLTTACLTISQDCGIVSRETAQHQVLDTCLEYILLSGPNVKDLVKGEGAIFSNDNLVRVWVA